MQLAPGVLPLRLLSWGPLVSRSRFSPLRSAAAGFHLGHRGDSVAVVAAAAAADGSH
jgi:hypothetical protein